MGVFAGGHNLPAGRHGVVVDVGCFVDAQDSLPVNRMLYVASKVPLYVAFMYLTKRPSEAVL